MHIQRKGASGQGKGQLVYSKRMGSEETTEVVDDKVEREREEGGYRISNALKLLMELATSRYKDKQQTTTGRNIALLVLES